MPEQLQRGLYDWVALSLALGASLRPASDALTHGRPPQMLCSVKAFILLAFTLLISGFMYWGCLAWLTSRPWYVGGTGNTYQAS